MGCFEDYMQFRGEVDEVEKKIRGHGASKECRGRKDKLRHKENISNPKPKA